MNIGRYWKVFHLLNSPNYFLVVKGLRRQRLIGSAVAGFNHAKTITKASVTDLHARQDDYNKGIGSPGSLVNNFTKRKILFNHNRNKDYLH